MTQLNESGANHACDQLRLRRGCSSAQSRQSLRCSCTQRMEVYDDFKRPISTTKLRLHENRISKERTKRSISDNTCIICY